MGDFPYLDLLSRVDGLSYPVMWRILLLGLIRFAPIVSLAPFLGAKLIPNTARVAIALSLSLMFLPNILFTMTNFTMTDTQFIAFAIKELIIGYVLGFFATVPFFIIQSSGIFIDFMRGSSQLMAQDPSTQTQTSSIGIMYNYFLIVTFYLIDGPFLFFDAIAISYEVFPIDSYINPLFFNLTNPLWQVSLGLINQVFTMALELASPCILAILMAEMFLGIANRLAPQVQIAFLGMSLKSLLGLTLLWSGWYYFLQQTAHMSTNWIKKITFVLNQLQDPIL